MKIRGQAVTQAPSLGLSQAETAAHSEDEPIDTTPGSIAICWVYLRSTVTWCA